MTDMFSKYTQDLTTRISEYEPGLEVRNVGEVIETGDGIAQVVGLTGVKSQELVQFENGLKGIAFNLREDKVGIIILGDYALVKEGMIVETTGRIASVPVGDQLIGRLVNAL